MYIIEFFPNFIFLQWVVLTRKHAEVVVNDNTVFPMFQWHCKARCLKTKCSWKVSKTMHRLDIPHEKEEIWYSCRWYMPGSISHLTDLGHWFVGYGYWVLYHLCFLLSNIYSLRTQVYTLLSSHQVVSFLRFSVCSGLVISLIFTCFICDNNAEEVPTWVLAGSTLCKFFFFFSK